MRVIKDGRRMVNKYREEARAVRSRASRAVENVGYPLVDLYRNPVVYNIVRIVMNLLALVFWFRYRRPSSTTRRMWSLRSMLLALLLLLATSVSGDRQSP